MIYILHTHNRDKNENKKDNHDNDANKDEDKDNARIVKDDGVRLTLANNKNKNKTKNLFLILSKRHRTTLAVEQKRKQNYYVEECSSANENAPFARQEQKFLMTYETYKMDYDHCMTILEWRTEWGCSHPIKSLWREHFSERYSFCFCKIGVSPDKTGGAVLSAEGSNKTENWVTRVLFASQASHSLFCFCFCFCRRQGSAW